jgi:hypothetical protein
VVDLHIVTSFLAIVSEPKLERWGLCDDVAGASMAAQTLEGLTEEEDYRKFYLQYHFPPSSVVELGHTAADSWVLCGVLISKNQVAYLYWVL